MPFSLVSYSFPSSRTLFSAPCLVVITAVSIHLKQYSLPVEQLEGRGVQRVGHKSAHNPVFPFLFPGPLQKVFHSVSEIVSGGHEHRSGEQVFTLVA